MPWLRDGRRGGEREHQNECTKNANDHCRLRSQAGSGLTVKITHPEPSI
jgi:hypothetical protein